MPSIRHIAPVALACAFALGHVPLAIAGTANTISLYEFGSANITTNDEPVLVRTDYDTVESHRPTFELTESFTGSGLHQITVNVKDPVAVLFGDWEIASAYTHTLTFTGGQGQRLDLGTYVSSYGYNGQDPFLSSGFVYPAFCPCFDTGPWLQAATFTIDNLERDASGKIQSFSSSFSSDYVTFYRDPEHYSMSGRIQYNMPVSSVPEADSLALALMGLMAVGAALATRRRPSGKTQGQ